ncbi:MAG: hypothetical protein V4692_09525 [Bdellovibrionota bacterium]
MKQLVLSQFPWPVLPTAALILFFVFFIGLFVVTHLRARTPIYKLASALPLEEGQLIVTKEPSDV